MVVSRGLIEGDGLGDRSGRWSYSVAIFAVIVITNKEEWYCRQKKQRPLWEAAGSYRNGTAMQIVPSTSP